MSIRLRLTILYSGILAITLIVFSGILYFAQVQLTLNDLKASLVRQAALLASGPRRSADQVDQPPPFTGNIPLSLPGRWTQILDMNGKVLVMTSDLSDTPLPLSEPGLVSVKQGVFWFEPAVVDEQPLLILSMPRKDQDQVTQIVQVATPTLERTQSLSTLRWTLTIGSVIATLAAFVIGWLLAGAALAPINRITRTAQTIGVERDFSHRVAHQGPNDEIGQLATTFNAMLTELQSAFQKVEQALHAQRRFVADASHELRTPLTTIRGNIELLRRTPPLDQNEQADVLSDAKDEVDRLIRLVQQLLVLARADAGRPLKSDPLPLQPLLEDVHRQAKLLAPNRMILLQASVDADILANRDALKQVLLILVDNALAHTPPTATITIGAALADKSVAISIRDNGPGIPPTVLPHIFERFYRGDVARGSSGTGLGLSIAEELVRAQGGTIEVSSDAGNGSMFTVTLPQVALIRATDHEND